MLIHTIVYDRDTLDRTTRNSVQYSTTLHYIGSDFDLCP